jgi:hypothetical protein
VIAPEPCDTGETSCRKPLRQLIILVMEAIIRTLQMDVLSARCPPLTFRHLGAGTLASPDARSKTFTSF